MSRLRRDMHRLSVYYDDQLTRANQENSRLKVELADARKLAAITSRLRENDSMRDQDLLSRSLAKHVISHLTEGQHAIRNSDVMVSEASQTWIHTEEAQCQTSSFKAAQVKECQTEPLEESSSSIYRFVDCKAFSTQTDSLLSAAVESQTENPTKRDTESQTKEKKTLEGEDRSPTVKSSELSSYLPDDLFLSPSSPRQQFCSSSHRATFDYRSPRDSSCQTDVERHTDPTTPSSQFGNERMHYQDALSQERVAQKALLQQGIFNSCLRCCLDFLRHLCLIDSVCHQHSHFPFSILAFTG
jgi:hypothetical protein